MDFWLCYSLGAVRLPLFAVASLTEEHRLWGTWASGVVVPTLSCSTACGIFLDQGSNLCLLHWQADSLPLSQQASSPMITQRHFLPLTSPSLYLRVIKHLRKMICGTFHNKFLFFAHFNIATFIFLSL